MALGLENPVEMRGKRGQAAAAERGALRKASSSWQPHPRQQGRESQGFSRGVPWGRRVQPALPGRLGQEGARVSTSSSSLEDRCQHLVKERSVRQKPRRPLAPRSTLFSHSPVL